MAKMPSGENIFLPRFGSIRLRISMGVCKYALLCSRRIQIAVAFSAITLVAIFLLLPADTDVQTTKTSPIHDAIPQFDSNATINDITPQFDSNATINDANNILAIEMYKRIEPNQNKNIFFSPLGILTVFAMMYEGADGDTASQLESVFGFSKDDSHRWASYYDLTKSFNDNSEDYDINLVNAVGYSTNFNRSQNMLIPSPNIILQYLIPYLTHN